MEYQVHLKPNLIVVTLRARAKAIVLSFELQIPFGLWV